MFSTLLPQIRKLVAAAVGLGLIVAHNAWGLELTNVEPALVDGIIALLTAIFVYEAPNAPAPPAPPPSI